MQGQEDTDSSCHSASDSSQFSGNDRCRWRGTSSGDLGGHIPTGLTSRLMQKCSPNSSSHHKDPHESSGKSPSVCPHTHNPLSREGSHLLLGMATRRGNGVWSYIFPHWLCLRLPLSSGWWSDRKRTSPTSLDPHMLSPGPGSTSSLRSSPEVQVLAPCSTSGWQSSIPPCQGQKVRPPCTCQREALFLHTGARGDWDNFLATLCDQRVRSPWGPR